MLKNILLVGFGGFAGTVLRYLTFILIDKRFQSSFPWSTFTVNIIGSLILGFIAGLLYRNHINESARLFMAIGFCGSFTTFSTFAYDNLQLLNQKPLMAVVYIITSVVIALMLVFTGFFIGKQI